MAEPGCGEVAGTLFAGVLGVLAGEPQRPVAAGDQALEQICGDGERRRALAGVQHAEPAAGARSYVEEAAAARKALSDGVDGLRDVRQLGVDSGGDGRVLSVDQLQHLQSGELVEPLGGGIAGLCEQRAERGLAGCGH